MKAGCTSTIEAAHDRASHETMADDAPRAMAGLLPRAESPIVPKHSIAGRALVAVVAIMTFLASLTTGAVMLVRSAAARLAVRGGARDHHPGAAGAGRAISRPTCSAPVEIARAWPGVADVRPYTKEESARLLEPWLGSGLSLDDLPVPRMIVVRLASGAIADLAALRRSLTRARRRREPRRSSRLDRAHAHDGATCRCWRASGSCC